MSLLLKQIYNFIRLLHSETGTNQLAAGLAIGVVIGFSPILSLQGLIIFVILMLFRIQMGAAFIGQSFSGDKAQLVVLRERGRGDAQGDEACGDDLA